MRLFKAIFKVSNIETCRGHELYQAAPESESSLPELKREGGRASQAYGDMRGWTELTQDDLEAGEDFENIVFITGGKPKEFMISAEPTFDPAERAALERLLKTHLDKVFFEELPYSPRRYRIHSDKPSIHIQAMTVPLDEDGNSIDIRPAFLRKLQDFAGAEGLLPGRGSTEFRRLPATPAKGEKHAMEVAEVRSKSKRAREAKLNELREIRMSLNELIHLHRAKLKTHNKNGSPTSHPSVTFDGTTFRREWLLREGHRDIVVMMDRLDHHRGTYDPELVTLNRHSKCEKLEALLAEGAQQKESPRNVAARLESEGLLSFFRSSKGSDLDDPALKFEGCQMREATLRREGRDSLADLIRDDGAGGPSGRSGKDRRTQTPPPQASALPAPQDDPGGVSAKQETARIPTDTSVPDERPTDFNTKDMNSSEESVTDEDPNTDGGPTKVAGTNEENETPDEPETGLEMGKAGEDNPVPPIPLLSYMADGQWMDKPGIIFLGAQLDTPHQHFAIPRELLGSRSPLESANSYKLWLNGTHHQEVEPEQREWILGQIPRLRQAQALLSWENDLHGQVLIEKAFGLADGVLDRTAIDEGRANLADLVLQFGLNFGKTLTQVDTEYLRWLAALDGRGNTRNPVPRGISKAAATLLKKKPQDIKLASEDEKQSLKNDSLPGEKPEEPPI